MCDKIGNIGSHLQSIRRSSIANARHLGGRDEARRIRPRAPDHGATPPCTVVPGTSGHPSGTRTACPDDRADPD
ncbi:hypothetical protein Sliba_70200 [Streptomyces nigrescens]|uniref:Uncharacterized protein n=1 Tax=Streptomyces nigrescens TaxID=1920 RepID=A0A640TSH1_STRNI|nr:hypothetical protein Sliba_70200 [Streptomyces libani subsp. libani]GGW00867.1 hypothetical protein GCM10010500_54690 [Streptomyces libani subsp. libani]